MDYDVSAIQPGDFITVNLVEGGYSTQVSGTVLEVQILRYLNMEQLTLEGDTMRYQPIQEVKVCLAGLEGLIDVTTAAIMPNQEEGE